MLVFCLIKAKFPKSFVQKVIINFDNINNFLSNCAYFLTYIEHQHKFQTESGKIFATHGYKDLVLCLVYPDNSEVI